MRSYASVIRFRKRARMMQPPPDPGHGAAIDVPVVLGARGRDLVKALGVGHHLGSVESLPYVLHELISIGHAPLSVPASLAWAASRCGTDPDSARAMVASAMPVIGTPRSRAFCGPAAGALLFGPIQHDVDEALPVSASTWPSTSAVISIKNDSRSPSFQVLKIWAISELTRRSLLDQVVRLGDQLHVGVLDAVVNHLDEVARAVGPT